MQQTPQQTPQQAARQTPASPTQASGLASSIQTFAVMASEAIRKGDRATAQRAFGHLHAQLFERIFLYIRRELQGTDDPNARAEELVNEVFLDFWLQLGGFDPARGSALGLIYRMARNKAHKALFRQRVKGRHEAPLEPTSSNEERSSLEVADPSALQEEALVEAINAAQRENNLLLLMARFQQQYPDHAELLKLRYQQDLNASELAQRLGIEAATARKRLEAARLTLFSLGWQWLREQGGPGAETLPPYSPRSPRELQTLLEQDPRVRECFFDTFGPSMLESAGRPS